MGNPDLKLLVITTKNYLTSYSGKYRKTNWFLIYFQKNFQLTQERTDKRRTWSHSSSEEGSSSRNKREIIKFIYKGTFNLPWCILAYKEHDFIRFWRKVLHRGANVPRASDLVTLRPNHLKEIKNKFIFKI